MTKREEAIAIIRKHKSIIPLKTVINRLASGWSEERACSSPVGKAGLTPIKVCRNMDCCAAMPSGVNQCPYCGMLTVIGEKRQAAQAAKPAHVSPERRAWCKDKARGYVQDVVEILDLMPRSVTMGCTKEEVELMKAEIKAVARRIGETRTFASQAVQH
jgi:hypothetical protein